MGLSSFAGVAHAHGADCQWNRQCEDGGSRKRCDDGGVRRIIGSKQGRTIWGSMDTVAWSMIKPVFVRLLCPSLFTAPSSRARGCLWFRFRTVTLVLSAAHCEGLGEGCTAQDQSGRTQRSRVGKTIRSPAIDQDRHEKKSVLAASALRVPSPSSSKGPLFHGTKRDLLQVPEALLSPPAVRPARQSTASVLHRPSRQVLTMAGRKESLSASSVLPVTAVL